MMGAAPALGGDLSLSQPAQVCVRAPAPSEGTAVARLWRELWDAHEGWGAYPGSRDPRVYAQLAHHIDESAQLRCGRSALGKHIHLVADLGGLLCGQVEGWFERLGADSTTPFTCEIRSLVVTRRARELGVGRALLGGLADAARDLSNGAPCVLAAEVLEPNPARAFYEHVGYVPIAHGARIDVELGASYTHRSARLAAARAALPRDAASIAVLDATLAARRRAAGDVRFDRPKAIDAARVGAIAAHFGSDSGDRSRNPETLLCVDGDGAVLGAALFAVQALEPPFLPTCRASLGRFAASPSCAPLVMMSLVGLASRLAIGQGAPYLELSDLSAPGTPLHAAAMDTGAVAWSRIVTKLA
jgi:GNAT superfamily N-acetyltransferase